MSAWQGKYVIGLTGNIATGKSVVRKMVEHLGAYGIDADALGHRAIARGAPGYEAVVDHFGKWVLSPDGQIDRSKLSLVVFSDADAMARLETIVHPLVLQAVDMLIRHSREMVIVLEAIKLIESGLKDKCDSTWVVYAPEETQVARLVQKRGMSDITARQRIAAQSPQQGKIDAADIIIRNDKSFDDTWQQVFAAWLKVVPQTEAGLTEQVKTLAGQMSVQRARPKQAMEIAEFINRVADNQRTIKSEDIIAWLGEKAFLLLKRQEKLVGIIGWQVENLIARVDDIYWEAEITFSDVMKALLEEMEEASRNLQCEIALLFIPPHLAIQTQVWASLGYKEGNINSLSTRAWQEAAKESMPPGCILFYKILRKDRVLRPV
ncbi:MAG: dephospho-CoA kinase [Anaerolineales bacterium]|nr:dephospho-CoA kinase [Anaerolineales bacterium]